MGGSFPAGALAPVDGLVAGRRGRRARPRRGRAAPGTASTERGRRHVRARADPADAVRRARRGGAGPPARADRRDAREPARRATADTGRAGAPLLRGAPLTRPRAGAPGTRVAPRTARSNRSRGRRPPSQLERALELDELREASDPDDRCELLLRARRHARARRSSGFSEAFAEAAALARGRSSTPARARRDRLRRPLLRGRRDRLDADGRCCARRSSGSGDDDAGPPRPCARPARRGLALRRRRGDLDGSRGGGGGHRRARWATTARWPPRCTGRHTSLLHVAHLERAARCRASR